MPRNLTPAMLDAITAPSFMPAIFVSIQFWDILTSTPITVNVWSGYGTITWNSLTWSGLGTLLGISQIEDGSTVESRGISIDVSGLDPTLEPDALSNANLGLPVTVWLAAISSGSVVADPVILYSGATDQPTFTIGPDEVSLSQACEELMAVMNIPVDRRLSPQDQQMTYPGDLGLQFVYQLIDVALYWGNQTKGASGPAGGSNSV